jgi:DNA uptake protein ComE-like DNA-binding protein
VKKFKSHFKFNRQEQSGIFFLLLAIIALHIGYFYVKEVQVRGQPPFQLNEAIQTEIEALKEKKALEDTVRIYPFNPNYITDYRGYMLGMSVSELDRLLEYRALGKFVNSAEEFQNVTRISDSLLLVISPYFKFPEWVTSKQAVAKSLPKSNYSTVRNEEKKKDLNKVTAEDLKKINGIGEVLSARAIKFRDRLGGFLLDEQLYDVYGLDKEVADRALNRFTVQSPPLVVKINVNEASVGQLSELVYIPRSVAQGIVDFRNVHGSVEAWEDLIKIKDFPAEKIERIKLYLTLKK